MSGGTWKRRSSRVGRATLPQPCLGSNLQGSARSSLEQKTHVRRLQYVLFDRRQMNCKHHIGPQQQVFQEAAGLRGSTTAVRVIPTLFAVGGAQRPRFRNCVRACAAGLDAWKAGCLEGSDPAQCLLAVHT